MLSILGAGSWGSALAIAAGQNGQSVCLWGHRRAAIDEMIHFGENTTYLPDVPFPSTVMLTSDLAQALAQSQDVLIAVPSHVFRPLLAQMAWLLTSQHRIAWATKGLDPTSGQLLHTTVADVLGEQRVVAALCGPSFAREVAKGLPTAVTVASDNKAFSQQLIDYFHSDRFRVYCNSDLVGVEVGGAVKNVLAIATGVSDGLGYGANARAALITRGLQEIMRLGVALGAKPETLMGLSGMGDLVLTCTDNQSRNRRLGLAIGQGKDIAQAQRDIAQVVEGLGNAKQVMQLAAQQGIDMPIVSEVYAILYAQKSPKDAVKALMSRESKAEV